MRILCVLLSLMYPLLATFDVQASPSCASNVSELKAMLGDQTFPLRWIETTMDDGKPLVVSIHERNGRLHVEFIKAREGLWAETTGLMCQAGTAFEARFTRDQIRMGPAANWLLRQLMGAGGKFTFSKVEPEQLRITTDGWSGHFSPHAQ